MKNKVHMAKYRAVIDRDRCIDCGIATGQCPNSCKDVSTPVKHETGKPINGRLKFKFTSLGHLK